jgi:hypothetical protein
MPYALWSQIWIKAKEGNYGKKIGEEQSKPHMISILEIIVFVVNVFEHWQGCYMTLYTIR